LGFIKHLGTIRHGKIRKPFQVKVKVDFAPSQNLDLSSNVFLESPVNNTSPNKCSVVDFMAI